MDANEQELLYEICHKVVGAAYEVVNVLGPGFLEKVYERTLVKELGVRGLRATAQAPISVTYKGDKVGDYYADILVEDKLIIELKCVDHLGREHIAQCVNYLKATGHHMVLLINLQHKEVEWKRVVYQL